jgi:hypothetical protein
MRVKPLLLLHPLFLPGAGCLVAKTIPRTSSNVVDSIYLMPQIRMAESSSKSNATRWRPFRPVADARFWSLILTVPGIDSIFEQKPSLQPRHPVTLVERGFGAQSRCSGSLATPTPRVARQRDWNPLERFTDTRQGNFDAFCCNLRLYTGRDSSRALLCVHAFAKPGLRLLEDK